MSGKKRMFTHLNESMHSNVSFGDDSKALGKGRGNILFRAKDDSCKLIPNVYYMSTIKANILSLGQLFEKGYNIYLKDCSLFMRDEKGHLITMVKTSKNKLFCLSIQNDVAKSLMACYKDLS